MNTEDKPLFELQHLCRSFKLERGVLPVIVDLNLTLPQKKWVAIVGRSGSGKSTLLQMLGALDKPTSGEIVYNGRPLGIMRSSELTELRYREFGFVFQSYHLLPELSAWENAVLPALTWGNNRGAAYQRAKDLLTQFGLGERLNHHAAELSGGEQQRVAIARALINDPPVILADEPTGNLDHSSGEIVVNILRELKNKYGKAIIMVTHDTALANQCDQIVQMNPA